MSPRKRPWSTLFGVKKFPLEPLLKLRAHAVDERKEALRERHRQVQDAQDARTQAERRERQHDAARRETDAAEQARAAEGVATVSDLLQLALYQAGAEQIAINLKQQSAVVQQRLQRAERDEAEAERALAEARAEQRVLDKEEARFVAGERAKLESAAEEEALEIWGSRRLRG